MNAVYEWKPWNAPFGFQFDWFRYRRSMPDAGLFKFAGWVKARYFYGKESTHTTYPSSVYIAAVANDPTMGAVVFQARTSTPAWISAFQSLQERFASFPVSYNQILAGGICAYCLRILSLFTDPAEMPEETVRFISELISELQDLSEQYNDSMRMHFSRIDLQRLEDRFELFQASCSDGGLFPKLGQATVEQLLGR